MYVRTISDMNTAITRSLWRVPTSVDVVAGIPRSGLLAANILALHLNRPLTDVEGLCEGRLLSTGRRPAGGHGNPLDLAARCHVLVVDDCVASGAEIARVKARIAEANLPHRVTYFSVYSFPERPRAVDIVCEVVPRPMVFEWSFLHSDMMEYVCLDIDGVLCVDPRSDQDDDGEEYLKFLQNAHPLFLPTREIGFLVTARLEKYRAQTEEWLARHSVKYRSLIMMDYPEVSSKRSRLVPSFKAAAYRESGAVLFVESDPVLAHHIAQLSNKPVLALPANELKAPSVRQRFAVRYQRATWWSARLRRAPRKAVRLASGVLSRR
jgi:uncharacterized HAD superfamily protein